MEKSCNSSGDSLSATTSTTGNSGGVGVGGGGGGRDQSLKNLNKLSHKISKPSIKKSVFDQSFPLSHQPHPHPHPHPHNPQPQPHPHNPQPPAQNNVTSSDGQGPQGNSNLHQPPVYNINKNDFRDVVQKLTGYPAHENRQISTTDPWQPAPPPLVSNTKPQSSRLQRIRPPPLAQIGHRPSPLMNYAAAVDIPNPGFVVPRPSAPLSPLPPLPPVHAAAESPVSAYMRCIQMADPYSRTSMSGFTPLVPLVSPRWCQSSYSHHPQLTTEAGSSSTPSSFQLSPFGCLNSPRSSNPLLSSNLLQSPNSNQPAFPLSPTVPVPSPKFKGL